LARVLKGRKGKGRKHPPASNFFAIRGEKGRGEASVELGKREGDFEKKS